MKQRSLEFKLVFPYVKFEPLKKKLFLKSSVKTQRHTYLLTIYLLSIVLWTKVLLYTQTTPNSHAHMQLFFFRITPTVNYLVRTTIRKLIRQPFAIFVIHRSCLKCTNGFSVKISLNIQFYRAFSTINHRNKLTILLLNIITSWDYRIKCCSTKENIHESLRF